MRLRYVLTTAATFAIIGIILLNIPVGNAQSWSQFQNDHANTGANLDANHTPVGNQELKTRVDSTVVWGEGRLIFFDSQHNIRGYGTTRMEQKWIVKRNYSFDRTPILRDGNTYFTQLNNKSPLNATRGTVASVDRSGNLRWQVRTDGSITPSLAVGEERLYVTVGETLRALDTKTGDTTWSADTKGTAGGLTIAGENVYAMSASIDRIRQSILNDSLSDIDGYVYSFGRDGKENWRVEAGSVTGYPAVSEDSLFYSTLQGNVHALDRENGETLWNTSVESIGTQAYFSDTYLASPVYRNGSLYVGTQNSLRSINASTGETRWSRDMDGAVYPPAVSGGNLYVASRGGDVSVLDATEGIRKGVWNIGQITSPPSVFNSTVYVASGDRVYAFDEQSISSVLRTNRTETETNTSESRVDTGNTTEVQDRNFTQKKNVSEVGTERYSPTSIVIPLAVGLLFLVLIAVAVLRKT
jgi:outer membrane protein assembly factor BamB